MNAKWMSWCGVVSLSLVIGLVGCSSPTLGLSKLAVVSVASYPVDDELLLAHRGDAIAAVADPEAAENYPESEFSFRGAYELPSQEGLPDGGRILTGLFAETGVSEVERRDLAVTVLSVPGRPEACLFDGIPSKGDGPVSFDVYDIGRQGELLVVAQDCAGGLGGGIRLILWDTTTGAAREIWACRGDEFGRGFCHEMRVGPNGRELVIHGIYRTKQPGCEPDRRELSAVLGIPVRFVYID